MSLTGLVIGYAANLTVATAAKSHLRQYRRTIGGYYHYDLQYPKKFKDSLKDTIKEMGNMKMTIKEKGPFLYALIMETVEIAGYYILMNSPQ